MKQLAIWILGLIECLILLMMKFIKVLQGEINAYSAGKSGKLIKIPGEIPVIKGTGPVHPGPTVNGSRGDTWELCRLQGDIWGFK